MQLNVEAFLEAIQKLNQENRMEQEVHHVQILQKGKIIGHMDFQPYQKDVPHNLFSLSKSFTAIAIGMAQSEGKLSIHDKVLDYLASDVAGEPSHYLTQLTLRHLLMMASGHTEDTGQIFGRTMEWTKGVLTFPMDHEPGTLFKYNTGATYLLSVIFKKATGEDLFDFLKVRMFDPMGMDEAKWEQSPEGISAGGFGLYLNATSIGKFGVLLLQEGMWEGQQIVSSDWIREATSAQIETSTNEQRIHEWEQGYGYQFWRCTHDSFRGDGMHGQFCVCVPSAECVVVMQSGCSDTAALLALIWSHLFGGLDIQVGESFDQHASAGFLHVQGQENGSLHVQHQTYQFEENPLNFETIQFGESERNFTLTFRMYEHKVVIHPSIGYQEWSMCHFEFNGISSELALSGAWTSDNTFTIIIRYIQEPYVIHIQMTQVENQLQMAVLYNLGFGPQSTHNLIGNRIV